MIQSARRPIVLAHGIFRLDQLRILLKQHFGINVGPHYFNGVLPHLEAAGLVVCETDASFARALPVS